MIAAILPNGVDEFWNESRFVSMNFWLQKKAYNWRMSLRKLVRPGDFWIVPVSIAGILLLGFQPLVGLGFLLASLTTALIWRSYGWKRAIVHVVLILVVKASI